MEVFIEWVGNLLPALSDDRAFRIGIVRIFDPYGDLGFDGRLHGDRVKYLMDSEEEATTK